MRGATKSLIIDMAFVLEGHSTHELPEALLGAIRLHHLDLSYAKHIDTTRELPLAGASRRNLTVPGDLPRSMAHSRTKSQVGLGEASSADAGRRSTTNR